MAHSKIELDTVTGKFRKVEIDPDAQEHEVEASQSATTSAPPPTRRERSWFMGEDKEGWDFKFKTQDGATVYGKYPENLPKAEQLQRALLAQSFELQEKAKAFQAAVNDPDNPLTADQLVAIETTLRTESSALTSQQRTHARALVKECICDWKGAPKPFSPAALDRLHPDICIEWVPQILQNSRLTQEESDFLSDSTESGTADAQPIGAEAATSNFTSTIS